MVNTRSLNSACAVNMYGQGTQEKGDLIDLSGVNIHEC